MSKIATKTIQYSIYDRTSGSAKFVEDTTSYTRPEIAMMTDSVAGSGIMGEIDMPNLGQLDSMEVELVLNKTNERAIAMFAPGAHTMEARWVTNVLNSADGGSQIQANKEIIKYLPKTLSMGDIENNETNEATLTGEVITYQYIIAGKTVIKIDKLNNVFIVNGKDYSSAIRAAL